MNEQMFADWLGETRAIWADVLGDANSCLRRVHTRSNTRDHTEHLTLFVT
jgi:hypothetical protein